MPTPNPPTDSFQSIADHMTRAGLPDVMIRTFERQVLRLIEGADGTIDERSIEPVDHVPEWDEHGDVEPVDLKALSGLALIKLNGGLGTSMGLKRVKSLLPARKGLSFLDLIVRQVLALRQAHGVGLPLVCMNSFSTEADTVAALQDMPGLTEGQNGVPLSFVQHKVPKLLADTLQPVHWPANPSLTWCPPGHGDLYPALVSSGVLRHLLDGGYRYAFVSNADNLGAVADPRILHLFTRSGAPMMMEVADRTLTDRKGGHIARLRSGGFILRESAQCPVDEKELFQDVERYRYFNTNSIWLDLQQLETYLDAHDAVIELPLIRNRKTVDPRDASSPEVFQLETAMGAALSVLPGATVLRVPRTRFAPVKTTYDLLVLWSDRYRLSEHGHLEPTHAPGAEHCTVQLDPAHYKMIDDFRERFPDGAPSLKACRSLRVDGDVRFGRDVVIVGDAVIKAGSERLQIPDASVIEGVYP